MARDLGDEATEGCGFVVLGETDGCGVVASVARLALVSCVFGVVCLFPAVAPVSGFG